MSTSRKAARGALKTLLTAALVGVGLPVKTVVDSKVTDLSGLTPLVSVLSGGTLRDPLTFQGDHPTFGLEVQVWVLQEESTGWTAAEAEDALDDIEALIAGVYESNRGTANWEILEYDGPSSIREMAVAGIPYFVERIPTTVRVAKT